jgi:hypothetical protein
MRRQILLAAGAFVASVAAVAGPGWRGATAATDAPKAEPKEGKAAAKKDGVNAAPPAPPPKADADEQLVRQVEQQYGIQIRQMYRMELHLMRLAARPTKAQYEKIAAGGESGVKQTFRLIALGMRGDRSDPGWPQASMSSAIAKAARTVLPPEQAAAYEKELELRAAARKRTALLTLVTCMDRLLALTPDQRRSVEAVLRDNWDKSWDDPQVVSYASQYLPPMPDAKLNPLLTPEQKEVWGKLQKGTVRFGFQVHFMDGVELPEEVWDEAPAAQAPAPREVGRP